MKWIILDMWQIMTSTSKIWNIYREIRHLVHCTQFWASTCKRKYLMQMRGECYVKKEANLPASFLTNCVVDELQPFYNLPKCWPLSWILIPALLNQSISIYHYSLDLSRIKQCNESLSNERKHWQNIMFNQKYCL